MADLSSIMLNDPFAQDPDTDSRGRPLSEFAKRCERCGKHTRMAIIHDPSYNPSRLQRFLLNIFAPGGIELDRIYECPRCGNQIHDLSFFEAVLAPILMISAIVLAMIAFLLFAFFVANA